MWQAGTRGELEEVEDTVGCKGKSLVVGRQRPCLSL